MSLEIKLGDIVCLKKPHPCGSCDWEVVRVGADIGLRCRKCQHQVLVERHKLEKKVKSPG